MYYLTSLASRGDLLLDASFMSSRSTLPAMVEPCEVDHGARSMSLMRQLAPDAIGTAGVGDGEQMTGPRGEPLLVNLGDVSYVIVDGMICNGPCFEYYCFGGVLMSDLIAALNAAAGSGTSRAVLVIDSPGGHSQGMDEVIEAVRRLKAAKPMSAMTTGMLCSGAYMLAALADEIVGVRRACVGSIGAVRSQDLIDDSRNLAEAGIDRYRIQRPGKMKAIDYGPLDGEIVQAETKRLDEAAYQPFREVVVEGRGAVGLTADVIDGLLGAAFSAVTALELKLIDRIVTPVEFVRETQTGTVAGAAPLVKTDRLGDLTMGNGNAGGLAPKPTSEVLALVAAMSLTDLVAARKDVMSLPDHEAAVQAATAKASQEHNVKAIDDAIKAEQARPASITELRELCGTDGNMVLSLLDKKVTVKQASDAIVADLREKLQSTQKRLDEVLGVRAKGGGGGADPVSTSVPAGAGANAKTFQAAVHAYAEEKKVSFNTAAYVLAADKNMKALHTKWLEESCPRD